ncbi:CBO0543 family protein [Alkalihalobacterium alkalinitrilicum]|uniref:CBO0543 family protein n=1 Tax=Alkalihalobacterium alkalinitrilicum TaxID=427920 RepID=UPI00099593FF|nr:CBO0543 family protein [Alkalihalobacterium alkalinitrilicum]
MFYATIIVGVLLLVNWFIPKHLKRRDMVIIWISLSYLEIVVDFYLGYVLELYKFAGEPVVSPEAFTTKLFMSPLFTIPFLNFMPKSFSRFIPYWLLWAAFSTFFEWTTVYFGYLTYTGWKLWYSAIFYVLIFPLVRRFYYYIKH